MILQQQLQAKRPRTTQADVASSPKLSPNESKIKQLQNQLNMLNAAIANCSEFKKKAAKIKRRAEVVEAIKKLKQQINPHPHHKSATGGKHTLAASSKGKGKGRGSGQAKSANKDKGKGKGKSSTKGKGKGRGKGSKQK
jgi:hypothetical protein